MLYMFTYDNQRNYAVLKGREIPRRLVTMVVHKRPSAQCWARRTGPGLRSRGRTRDRLGFPFRMMWFTPLAGVLGVLIVSVAAAATASCPCSRCTLRSCLPADDREKKKPGTRPLPAINTCRCQSPTARSAASGVDETRRWRRRCSRPCPSTMSLTINGRSRGEPLAERARRALEDRADLGRRQRRVLLPHQRGNGRDVRCRRGRAEEIRQLIAGPVEPADERGERAVETVAVVIVITRVAQEERPVRLPGRPAHQRRDGRSAGAGPNWSSSTPDVAGRREVVQASRGTRTQVDLRRLRVVRRHETARAERHGRVPRRCTDRACAERIRVAVRRAALRVECEYAEAALVDVVDVPSSIRAA